MPKRAARTSKKKTAKPRRDSRRTQSVPEELPRQEKPTKTRVVRQARVGKAIKAQAEHVRWLEKERLRLAGASTKTSFDKLHRAFEKEETKRALEVRGFHDDAERERHEHRMLENLPPEVEVWEQDWASHFTPRLQTRPQSYELFPWKKTVAKGGAIANLFEQPNDALWRAEVWNGQVSVRQFCRFWLPPVSSVFTGEFHARPQILVAGVVDIKSGGYVRVWAEASVMLRRCTNPNTSHDAHFHYDRMFDTQLCHWQSKCQRPDLAETVDTTYGVHAFQPRVDVYANARGVVPLGTGYFVDTFTYVDISAVNAKVFFHEPDPGGRGTVQTPHPRLELIYNVLPPAP